jgi:hypothetical protein
MRQGEGHGYDLEGDKGRNKVTKTMIPKCYLPQINTNDKRKREKGFVASMYNCYIFDPTVENLRTKT